VIEALRRAISNATNVDRATSTSLATRLFSTSSHGISIKFCLRSVQVWNRWPLKRPSSSSLQLFDHSFWSTICAARVELHVQLGRRQCPGTASHPAIRLTKVPKSSYYEFMSLQRTDKWCCLRPSFAMPAFRFSKRSTTDISSPDTTIDATLKASFDDLRREDSREVLRQHFSGAFPEATRKTSQEWERQGVDPGARGMLSRSATGLFVGENPAATSSTSSVDTPNSNGNKRLSTVQETQSTIDIAQAIHLLQELKKTASPDDLVALHKALLPTRDSALIAPSMPNNEDRSSGNFSTTSVIRRTSLVPPGLATRGGASADILRSQEDAEAASARLKKLKKAEYARVKQKGSQSSLAALDLADDAQQSKAGAITSPDKDYTQVGHYRTGTLRVTNGAASPDNSIYVRQSTELVQVDTNRSLSIRESRDYCTAPTTPTDRPSAEYRSAHTSLERPLAMPEEDFQVSLQSRLDLRDALPSLEEQSAPSTPREGRPRSSSISGIPHPQQRDESVPRVYKRQWPHPSRDRSRTRDGPEKKRSQSLKPRSRDSSLSRLPLPREKKAGRKASDHSLHFSRQSLEPLNPSIDDGRVSPMAEDVPRFAHRWSHRASQISQEYTADCDIQPGPYASNPISYADKQALLQRLSTVYDGEDDVETFATETPDVALSKLTGNTAARVEAKPKRPTTLRTKAPSAPSSPFARSQGFERPSAPEKMDSGYGTDTSSRSQRWQAPKAKNESSKFYNRALKLDVDEAIDVGEGDDDDVRSLYNLQQILSSPDLLSPLGSAGPTTPQTPGSNKKHISLLKLAATKRGSSNDVLSSPALGTTPESSPSDPKSAKQSKKKLQKPMPDAVKKELKEKRRKEKESLAAKSTTTVGTTLEVPDLPEVVIKPARFSWEPETAIPTPTQQTFTTGNVDQDASPRLPETGYEASGFTTDVETEMSKSPFTRSRSKNRGRNRSNSTRQQKDNSTGKMQRSWSLRRTDNQKSRESLTTKQSGPFSCMSPTPGPTDDDEAPMWTDYSSVSRTLGVNPYDISTTMVRKTIALPGAISTQLQSPHQISTTVSRTKKGGLQGMDSSMASELARMKSRDVAISNNETVYDKPRMATPRRKTHDGIGGNMTARVRHTPSLHSATSQATLAQDESQQEPVELSARPLSTYSESIPPLPELPADVRRVVSKVDIMVAKRIKDSKQPSPDGSERNSEEKPGDSTVSVADAVRKALEAKKPEDSGVEKVEKRKRPSGPRQKSSNSLQVQVQKVLRTPSSESIPIGLGSDVDPVSPLQSPRTTEDKTAIAPDWSKHAQAWKERRKSLGETLSQPVSPMEARPLMDSFPSPPNSPAIFISRYITPDAKEIVYGSLPPKDARRSADERANAYRELIEDNNSDNQPATPPTHVISKYDHPATLRPHSAKERKTLDLEQQPIERARSPGGRVITPSGNYHPFTPANAGQAEKSRAASLAKLTGSDSNERVTQSLDLPRPQAAKTDSNDLLFDRFSGGLQYGYERGAGFSGSAGTRVRADAGRRKGKELSEKMGVDLSDVPVFYSKVSAIRSQY
jgi:serine/arginine repetitive matrix protein 2